jgi:hypothetical protein
MVSSWLGYTNWWVDYLGWVAFCGAVEPLDAQGKVLPTPCLIQRKLLTFIHTLFTVFFSLNTTNNNCLQFIGSPRPILGFSWSL